MTFNCPFMRGVDEILSEHVHCWCEHGHVKDLTASSHGKGNTFPGWGPEAWQSLSLIHIWVCIKDWTACMPNVAATASSSRMTATWGCSLTEISHRDQFIPLFLALPMHWVFGLCSRWSPTGWARPTQHQLFCMCVCWPLHFQVSQVWFPGPNQTG